MIVITCHRAYHRLNLRNTTTHISYNGQPTAYLLQPHFTPHLPHHHHHGQNQQHRSRPSRLRPHGYVPPPLPSPSLPPPPPIPPLSNHPLRPNLARLPPLRISILLRHENRPNPQLHLLERRRTLRHPLLQLPPTPRLLLHRAPLRRLQSRPLHKRRMHPRHHGATGWVGGEHPAEHR